MRARRRWSLTVGDGAMAALLRRKRAGRMPYAERVHYEYTVVGCAVLCCAVQYEVPIIVVVVVYVLT